MSPLYAFLCWSLLVTLLGLGNTVGYHRLLTHRSFTARRPVRWALTVLGAVHSGSPILWVGAHRLHHLRSDTDEDPHSPERGFWWAHCGWLIGTENPALCMLFAASGFGQQAVLLAFDLRRLSGNNPPVWRELCPDLLREPLMRWLDVPLVIPALFALQVAIAWVWLGPWGLFALWALHLALTNGSWAVNSVGHWPGFGTQNYDTGDSSRDVVWLAWITHGEGHHNSHHRFPKSARHGLHAGPDFSWLVIWLLVKARLASDPWLPRAFRPQPAEKRGATT